MTPKGGSVRKGEKGMPVVFWRWHEVEEQGEQQRAVQREIPILRYYTVFNVAQCEGLDVGDQPTELEFKPPQNTGRCEDVASRMADPPTFQTRPGRAYYQPASDTITLPPPWHFESPAAYATLLHEQGHSTGHERRLGREAVTDPARFGSHVYSRKELVAELTAAYLCGHCAIDTATLNNTAAYIGSWLEVLRGDGRLVIVARRSRYRIRPALAASSMRVIARAAIADPESGPAGAPMGESPAEERSHGMVPARK